MTNKAAQMLGKRGGLATKSKYGVEHYRKLAEHMNKIRAEKKAKQNEVKLLEAERNLSG